MINRSVMWENAWHGMNELTITDRSIVNQIFHFRLNSYAKFYFTTENYKSYKNIVITSSNQAHSPHIHCILFENYIQFRFPFILPWPFWPLRKKKKKIADDLHISSSAYNMLLFQKCNKIKIIHLIHWLSLPKWQQKDPFLERRLHVIFSMIQTCITHSMRIKKLQKFKFRMSIGSGGEHEKCFPLNGSISVCSLFQFIRRRCQSCHAERLRMYWYSNVNKRVIQVQSRMVSDETTLSGINKRFIWYRTLCVHWAFDNGRWHHGAMYRDCIICYWHFASQSVQQLYLLVTMLVRFRSSIRFSVDSFMFNQSHSAIECLKLTSINRFKKYFIWLHSRIAN